MKPWILLALLAAGQALAQGADISGAQLLSGNADARLQSLAREAAAANRRLVISAPEYWHEMILEQVRRGGGDALQVEVRDSFAEAVMVRSEAIAPPAPAPPAAVASAPASTARSPAPAPRPASPAPRPAPAATSRPAPPSAPAVLRPVASAAAPAIPTAGGQGQPPARTPGAVAAMPAIAPAAPPVAAPATTSGSAAAETAAIRRRFEQGLNGGRPITRTLGQTLLEPGDVLYVRGDVIAVQRRDSLRSLLFWLEGGIELLRIELRETGPGRYLVMDRIRNVDNPRLRAVRSDQPVPFVAADPSRHAGERAELERRYNGGNAIAGALGPADLSARDVLYVGDSLAVVVRVNGLELERYFLVGQVDLGRGELRRDGINRYRVLSDFRR
ncbi:MAG: hypothetical protein ACK59M_02035 [Pseudomonadota bacterium]